MNSVSLTHVQDFGNKNLVTLRSIIIVGHNTFQLLQLPYIDSGNLMTLLQPTTHSTLNEKEQKI